MKFRTECKIEIPDFKISFDTSVVGIGSCFAQNIIKKLREHLMHAVNPTGRLFNPFSIAKIIELSLFSEDGCSEVEDSLFFSDGICHSYLLDSCFSKATKEDVMRSFEEASRQFKESLEESGILFVTFGTAYCYFYANDENKIIGNCHKQPSEMFRRRRLSIEEIAERWISLIQRLNAKLKDLKIIFTVSPVRHLKDGLHENNLSKSILHLATSEICEEFTNCYYFPAYEIVNDDLRDYRFYSEDLAHPSEAAIEYIWEKFTETYFDEQGKRDLKEGNGIYKRMSHRPIMADDSKYRQFIEETGKMYAEFAGKHKNCLMVSFP